jgi:hypothetical protein
MISREQIIDILKNGARVQYDTGRMIERGFVSFGQLPPEVQTVAKEIGKRHFTAEKITGLYMSCCVEDPFHPGVSYKLDPDYIDPPKESEFEYLEIKTDTVLETYFFLMPDKVWPNNQVQKREGHLVTDAPAIVGFLGYAKTLDQKDNFQQTFTSDMKFVVLKKKGK